MFVPLGVEQFKLPVFTGGKWNLVPPNLRNAAKPHKKKNHNQNPNPNPNPGNGFPTPPPGRNPNPYPTYSCDPAVVTCNPNAPGDGTAIPSRWAPSGRAQRSAASSPVCPRPVCGCGAARASTIASAVR